MYPHRTRFPKARLALGIATALVVVVLACDMPSPEVVAPDGKNEATKRLYGKVEAAMERSSTDTRAIVAQYFPAIARGAEGPTILFLVKSDKGTVVLTETQAASQAMREKIREPAPAPRAAVPERERGVVETDRDRVTLRERPSNLVMLTPAGPRQGSSGVVLSKVPARAGWIPSGVGALRPEDINTVDVSKHAAGTVAPNAVSLVTITLKPGAVVPRGAQR